MYICFEIICHGFPAGLIYWQASDSQSNYMSLFVTITPRYQGVDQSPILHEIPLYFSPILSAVV